MCTYTFGLVDDNHSGELQSRPESTPCLFLSELPHPQCKRSRLTNRQPNTTHTHTTQLSNRASPPSLVIPIREPLVVPVASFPRPLCFWFLDRSVWYVPTELLCPPPRFFQMSEERLSHHTEWLPAMYISPDHVYNYYYMFQHHYTMDLWPITTS